MKSVLIISLLSLSVIGCSHSAKNNVTSDSIASNYNYNYNENVIEIAVSPIIDKNLEYYKEVLDTLNTNGDSLIHSMYFTYDLIGDSIPELWLKTGTCEADYILSIYTRDKGKTKKVLESDGGHSDFFPYNDDVIRVSCNTGGGYVSRLTASGSDIMIESSEFSMWNESGEPLADDKSFNPILKYWNKNPDKYLEFVFINSK
ncbi:MAG: hypothetical protein K2M94_07945 [Paramuribaculum sp.]|nr:hypothetical protein [Paramuribaculum sp.]